MAVKDSIFANPKIFPASPSATQPSTPASQFQTVSTPERFSTTVDVLLVNPPLPDKDFWQPGLAHYIRQENMVWPQVSLAQLAAMLTLDYQVEIVDAAAQRLNWSDFEAILREKQPRYYLTQLRPATFQNDLLGVVLARELGAKTIAFGPQITERARDIIEFYPHLDFILRDEPELTLRELIDTLETIAGRWAEPQTESRAWLRLVKAFKDADPEWQPAWVGSADPETKIGQIQGLTWHSNGKVIENKSRPYIANLDDLPLPHHHLLPLNRYRTPLHNQPFAFVSTSRGYAETMVTDNQAIRFPIRTRTPTSILTELWLLYDLGLQQVHIRVEGFSANREQIINLCQMMIAEEFPLPWTCTCCVDQVDAEILACMARAGCHLIIWDIEALSTQMSEAIEPTYRIKQVPQVLTWAKQAGIKNCGYFTIGVPGQTEKDIQETIDFAKELPLDLALFHPAISYSHEVTFNIAFNNRQPTQESLATSLPPERLEYWQKRAFREWAFRSGSIWTRIKGLKAWARFRNVATGGLQSTG